MDVRQKEEETEPNMDLLDTSGFWTQQDENNQTTTNQKIISLCKHGPLSDFLAIIQNDSFASSSIVIDMDIMDESGWCPLTHAAFNGHSEIIQNIIAFQEEKYRLQFGDERVPDTDQEESDKDINKNASQGELQWKRSMKKFLCSKLSYNGSTALHLACARGHEQIAKLLLNKMINEYKIDPSDSINAVDYDLATPLHCSVLGKHYNMMLLLLMNGAVINKCDRHGKSPVDWAADRNLHEFIASFKQYENSNQTNSPQQGLLLPSTEDTQHKSVGSIWEEHEYKSPEMSLEDLLVEDIQGKNPEQLLSPEEEEELFSFRANAQAFVPSSSPSFTNEGGDFYGPRNGSAPPVMNHGHYQNGDPLPHNCDHNNMYNMHMSMSPVPFDLDPQDSPHQQHYGMNGINGFGATFPEHFNGNNYNHHHRWSVHDQHHHTQYQQQYHHPDHRQGNGPFRKNRQILPYRETAPRHFRYNKAHNKKWSDHSDPDRPHSEPALRALENSDTVSLPAPLTRAQSTSGATKTTTEWDADLENIKPAHSAPISPTKKRNKNSNLGVMDQMELDIRGLNLEALDGNGSGPDSLMDLESVWKTRYDAMSTQFKKEREQWQREQQTMMKRMEMKQSQIHDMRHKLRRMRRFLDDLPNGIKMRFYKTKTNFKTKSANGEQRGTESGQSVSSTQNPPLSKSKVTRRRMMEHTPIPNRGDTRKKGGKCRSRVKARMVRVNGKASSAIKRKNVGAG